MHICDPVIFLDDEHLSQKEKVNERENEVRSTDY